MPSRGLLLLCVNNIEGGALSAMVEHVPPSFSSVIEGEGKASSLIRKV